LLMIAITGCQWCYCDWKWTSNDASSSGASHSIMAFWPFDRQDWKLPIYINGGILYHDCGCRCVRISGTWRITTLD
jgi:hypothetical protein